MKTRTACTARGVRRMAFACLALVALSAAAVELRGFRGLPWGTDVLSLGPAQLLSDKDGVRCYQREQENLLYGDAPLSAVRYCFHQDRLFMVIVDSKVTPQALQAEFQSTYGPPAERTAAKAMWGDRSTRARVEIAASAAGAPAFMRITSNQFGPREKHAQGNGD